MDVIQEHFIRAIVYRLQERQVEAAQNERPEAQHSVKGYEGINVVVFDFLLLFYVNRHCAHQVPALKAQGARDVDQMLESFL